ncbi:hypothetical protein BU14_0185s0023 [Porphyra umbilicalis]|uniref:Secreted protein n=1 Tax=Porphyra umbilicalis TaxID=2786 RepID=A0A1X6P7G5_PORUM|nr:hypothetical protein BU14_0185s0023 [Porphyra umbilicalis]|eukprot:OSX76563.1 hypothetical protein BU14_0185s0023 [Porphyra umbilicalis]
MAFRKTASTTLIAAVLVATATLTTTPPAAAAPMPTGGEELPFTPDDLTDAINSCNTLTAACKAGAAAGGDPGATFKTCDYCSEVCLKAVGIVEVLGRPAEAPQWTEASWACALLMPELPDAVGTPEAGASDEHLPA